MLNGSSQLFNIAGNKLKSALVAPEHIHIDIAHKHFQKLAYKREVARQIGLLESSDDDFVPAKIRHNGQSYDVKLRLKGDAVDHLDGDKWSYRVKVKGDKALFGMRTLSIQHPKTRNYLAEWVYHQALKREDIISLRYDFVNVSVNGKNLGIFALEEHFNKILVEDNQRRQGPIIRFSEDQVWKQDHLRLDFPKIFPVTSASFNSVLIDAFESKAIAADSSFNEQFMHAITLLETYRRGEQRARDVFDIEKLAMYLAISELLGAHHSVLWNHMRFYYNPITARLEPIGFDGNAGLQLPLVTATMDLETSRFWRREIFNIASQDPLFNRHYFNALAKVSKPDYLASLFEEIQPEFDNKLKIIHKTFPDYEFPFENLEKNRKLLHYTVHPEDGLRTHFIAHHNDSLTLEVGSTQPLPVALHALLLGEHTISLEEQPLLEGRHAHSGIAFTQIRVAVPTSSTITDSTLSTFNVTYGIPGSDSLQVAPILPYPHSKRELVKHAIPRDSSTIRFFSFLQIDDKQKKVIIKQGSWTVDRSLIVPEGYTLNLTEGTSLNLINSAAILVHGAVDLTGSATSPIRISSSDQTGQGLTVLNADSPSHIRHTSFENQQNIHQKGWALTGSVNFYESPVTLHNVTFTSNQSEDALNIIRTSYEMDSVLFAHTYSDAFDGDFTSGTISNSRFENPGNDAIDVSGSTLTFHNVHVYQAGDKALSAGEFSRVTGSGLEVTTSNIGVASKDQSIVKLTEVHIANSQIGLALYQKKPEFGPGSLEINNVSIEQTPMRTLIEEGSLLLMDGERIEGDKKQVANQLY